MRSLESETDAAKPSWVTRAGRLHQGGPFREESLRRLLTNRLYIGLVRQGGQDYPGEHEAIVDRNSWDRVQQLLDSTAPRRKSTVANVDPLGISGKLSCTCCGGLMRAVPRRRHSQPYRYYVCAAGAPHRTSPGCVCASLPADELDRIVSNSIDSETGSETPIADGIERVIWAAEHGELMIHRNDGQERVVGVERVRGSHRRIVLRTGDDHKGQPGPQSNNVAGPIPRISRLVALALRLDEVLKNGAIESVAEVARLGNVTMARVRQILNLLDLAPDIQEQLLFLPVANPGCAAVTEREVRQITIEIDWEQQRDRFAELTAARTTRKPLPPGVQQ